ncbi:hypothetical protein [Sphingobium tyrosinilyticum]|uniref:Spore coat protein U domain-containing protein n=1 Tax=Sphingobium tyrosinilyticum TaxID=2715436 RepID=A0ABV9EZP2_9SPHN
MSKWTKLAGVALAFGIAQPAMAANCATVSFSTLSLPEFDPISGTYVQTITANVTSVDNQAGVANFILVDNETGPLQIGLSGPEYNITSSGSTIIFPNGRTIADNHEGAQVNLSNNFGSVPLTLTVTNNSRSDFVGGMGFSEPFKYSIQCYKNATGSGNGVVLKKDENQTGLALPITIKKVASFSTASPQTINFGNFTTLSQQIQIGLKSTSSINVNVQTANINQMVLAGAVSPYPTNSTIPYSMTLNGASVSNGTNLTNQTRAGVAGMNWPLVLSLPSLPTGKIAGSYSDTITLTLTAGI